MADQWVGGMSPRTRMSGHVRLRTGWPCVKNGVASSINSAWAKIWWYGGIGGRSLEGWSFGRMARTLMRDNVNREGQAQDAKGRQEAMVHPLTRRWRVKCVDNWDERMCIGRTSIGWRANVCILSGATIINRLVFGAVVYMKVCYSMDRRLLSICASSVTI